MFERLSAADQGNVMGRLATALFIAWRNLTRERRRWLLSASALADDEAMMVLFLQGISRWLAISATASVDHSGAQLVVSEKGIEDLLFAHSSSTGRGPCPRSASVAPRAPIDAAVVTVDRHRRRRHTHLPVYLVGFQPNTGGGPWDLVAGSATPHGDEVVVDRGFAGLAGVAVGSTLTLFGHRLRVVGISEDTNAAGDFFLFAPLRLAQERGRDTDDQLWPRPSRPGCAPDRCGSEHQSDSRP